MRKFAHFAYIKRCTGICPGYNSLNLPITYSDTRHWKRLVRGACPTLARVTLEAQVCRYSHKVFFVFFSQKSSTGRPPNDRRSYLHVTLRTWSFVARRWAGLSAENGVASRRQDCWRKSHGPCLRSCFSYSTSCTGATTSPRATSEHTDACAIFHILANLKENVDHVS